MNLKSVITIPILTRDGAAPVLKFEKKRFPENGV